MSFFDRAYSEVMGNEGGYANNANDKGGETYCGISRRFHPNWNGWKYIDKIKQIRKIKWNEHFSELDSSVRDFYHVKFWNRINGDAYTNYELAVQMFDAAVNCNTIPAAKFLQRTLNVLNRRGTLWKNLDPDGQIGENTIKALNAALKIINTKLLLIVFNIIRGSYYVDIMEADESQEDWARNWISRLHIQPTK